MHLVCAVGQVGGTGQVALQVPFWQRLVPVGQLMGPGPQLAWHVRSLHRTCPTGQEGNGPGPQLAWQEPSKQMLCPVGHPGWMPGPQLAWHEKSAHRFCPAGQAGNTPGPQLV